MSYDITTARELLEDAQQHMQQACDALARYVRLTGDRNAEAYILDHLRIMTSADHGFLTRDISIDDVIERLAEEADEGEDDGPDADDEPGRYPDSDERFLRLVERSGGEPRLSGLYGNGDF